MCQRHEPAWLIGSDGQSCEVRRAELFVVKTSTLVKVPAAPDLIESAALPLVITTGNELISATEIKSAKRCSSPEPQEVSGVRLCSPRIDAGQPWLPGLKEAGGRRENRRCRSGNRNRRRQGDSNLPPLDRRCRYCERQQSGTLLTRVRAGGVFASALGGPLGTRSTHR